ncbi:MAG: formylmethanofuran--tetrahydromethanopterin N-formyltransferase [Methanobrevibacter thaueri]|nr:formylmethanofuran--tetrahydromethanopterin N-formyltransferase [Methanobrevibacter thaueri]
MEINGVEIKDTYAEGFGIKVTRILVTAATEELAKIAATEATGYGTSVIGCPAEAGIDCFVPAENTPDKRPGYVIMICQGGKKALDHELMERIGMCILTAPTAAAFNCLESEDVLKTGNKLKFFGDGFETELEIEGRKIHSIPIMSGDFLVESAFGYKDGVAGGNFFILAKDQMTGVKAAQAAVEAISKVEGTITPFPGGMVASGSKVGSNKYSKFLNASTNEKMCVTLKDKVDSDIRDDADGVFEIVIDGVDEDSVKAAMKAGIEAACAVDGVLEISAGNFDGKLGSAIMHLHELF